MTMRIYQSTDASAPTLQGVVGGALSGSDWADGSLLQLLRKVLVTGYGSKTAAGWTQSFAGTSKGVFRQGGGCQFYLRVLDDGSLTAGAREAQFYGGETASDVDTLTGQFPTSTQQSTYLKFRKSNKADSTQRSWLVMADNKTFYIWCWSNQGDGATDYLTHMAFGDFYSFHPGDAYNCLAIGRVTSATLDAAGNDTGDTFGCGSSTGTASLGHYFARGYSQAGGSVNFSKVAHMFITASSAGEPYGFAGIIAFPNPADNRMLLGRVYIDDPTTVPTHNLRGYLRGIWNPQHASSTSAPREYPFSGVGSLAGRTFKILGLRGASNAASTWMVETSDTWD